MCPRTVAGSLDSAARSLLCRIVGLGRIADADTQGQSTAGIASVANLRGMTTSARVWPMAAGGLAAVLALAVTVGALAWPAQVDEASGQEDVSPRRGNRDTRRQATLRKQQGVSI